MKLGKIDKQAAQGAQAALDQDLSQDFVKNIRSDAFNVDNELRRRLGPQAVAAIVGIPPSLVANDGTRIDIATIVASSGGLPVFNVQFTCILADSIDQMSRLLPDQ